MGQTHVLVIPSEMACDRKDEIGRHESCGSTYRDREMCLREGLQKSVQFGTISVLREVVPTCRFLYSSDQ